MQDRELLQALLDGPASGDALARRFGLTRAAVWKRIEALRQAGLAIAARAGRGYRLEADVDLLDADAIRAALPAEAARLSGDLDVAWSLDSTNAALLREEAPTQGTRVLLAERQTAGRGRRGRTWESPLAAHLYLSASRRFAGGLARLGGLSLAAGVAVAEALHGLGLASAQLKWPNDVVADGRKLGGLLVEGSGEAAGSARAVVGIGLNVRMPGAAGARIGQPWTDLRAELATTPPRSALAAAVLAQLLPALERFDRDGLAPFLPRYERLDALRGRAIALHGGDGGVVHGDALGIAEDGALRVRVAGAERRFHAGEVSVRGA